MNISYLIYQAERTRSAAEQREADVPGRPARRGHRAAGRAGRRAVTAHQGTGLAGGRTAPATASCAIPRPR